MNKEHNSVQYKTFVMKLNFNSKIKNLIISKKFIYMPKKFLILIKSNNTY